MFFFGSTVIQIFSVAPRHIYVSLVWLSLSIIWHKPISLRCDVLAKVMNSYLKFEWVAYTHHWEFPTNRKITPTLWHAPFNLSYQPLVAAAAFSSSTTSESCCVSIYCWLCIIESITADSIESWFESHGSSYKVSCLKADGLPAAKKNQQTL